MMSLLLLRYDFWVLHQHSLSTIHMMLIHVSLVSYLQEHQKHNTTIQRALLIFSELGQAFPAE